CCSKGEAVVEAGGGIGGGGGGRVGEGNGRGAAFVDRAVVREGRGRGDVIDGHRRVVIGVAVVLVEKTAIERIGAVVVEGERGGGSRTGRGVAAGEASRGQGEAVMEAGGRIGGRGVRGAAE